jgi:hypothetical protein
VLEGWDGTLGLIRVCCRVLDGLNSAGGPGGCARARYCMLECVMANQGTVEK